MKTGGLGQKWVEILARGDPDFDLKMRWCWLALTSPRDSSEAVRKATAVI